MQNTKQLQTAAAAEGCDTNNSSSLCPKPPHPLSSSSWSNTKFCTHSSLGCNYKHLSHPRGGGCSGIIRITFGVYHLRPFNSHGDSDNAPQKILLPLPDKSSLSTLVSFHSCPTNTETGIILP